MNEHSHAHEKLTKNQSLVMNTLKKSASPLSAYTILDLLRDDGFRAPLQVYRALDKLVETGLIHRLESLNAFVACQHPSCEDQEIIAFMICDQCEEVSEISDKNLSDQLKKLSNEAKFALKKAAIELTGICSKCQAAS